jgi:phosphate transport system protein
MSTRLAFREAMGGLRADVHWLGSMAEDSVRAATGALFGGDHAAAKVVVDGDDELDTLFLELEQRAYALIAQQAPVAIDLRFLVSSLRVMADFERIGDQAVAIAHIAMDDWDREPRAVALLERMSGLSLRLLGDARRAWREHHLELAADLERRDDALDACYRQLIAHLVNQNGTDVSRLVMNALLVGRNLERIADHAVAVGERVRYMLTGDPDSLAAEIR